MLSIWQDCQIFYPTGIPTPDPQFSRHFTKKGTDSALISWIFVNVNDCRLKKSMIALVPPIGTKKLCFGGLGPWTDSFENLSLRFILRILLKSQFSVQYNTIQYNTILY